MTRSLSEYRANTGCSGKVRFQDRKAAKAAKNQMRGKGQVHGHLQAYRCDHCGFFHLGHLSPDVFRGVIDKDDWKGA